MRILAFTLFLFVLIPLHTTAFESKIQVDPSRPFVEESFKVFVHIYSETREEPSVSFDPGGLNILSRNTTTSTTTIYRGGKFTTKIQYTFSYDMSAPTAKDYRLTNITIALGDQKKRLPNKLIKVFSGPEKLKNYFLETSASKETIFLGEGIDVEYYLYSRVPVIRLEIKEYPKLNDFIKRFVEVRNRTQETVNYRGAVYKKYRVYATRLYPGKTGRLYIDPLKLTVAVRSLRHSSWNRSPVQTRVITNSPVKILVKPLPANNVPSNFTGLIGNHEITFSLNKTKFLVNEIVEGKFEITGDGFLEKFDAPVIYQHKDLEQFDTRSEMVETQTKISKKVFDYTFIPRAALSLDAKSFSLSFFDPNREEYVEKTISLPALVATGEMQSAPPQGHSPSMEEERSNPKATHTAPLALVGPMDINQPIFIIKNFKIVNMAIILLILITFICSIEFRPMGPTKKKMLLKKIQTIQKKGITYKNFYDLLSTYHGKELAAQEIVTKSSLGPEAKAYFTKILDKIGHHEFAKKKDPSRIDINIKFFKEFLK